MMWSGRRVDMGLNDTLIGSPVENTCSALIGTTGALIGSAVGTSAGKMAARNNTAGKTAAGNTNAGKNGTNNPSNTHSLFFGRNFVFDARGSVGVTNHVVGWCDGCGASTDSVKACASAGCHTLLLVCQPCCNRGEASDGWNGELCGVADAGDVQTEKRTQPETRNVDTHCCETCWARDRENKAAIGGAHTGKRRRPCECDGFAARARRLGPRPEISQ